MFCNPGPQSKIGRAIGILLISKFGWGYTKTVVESRVLVRGNFFLYNLKAYVYSFIFSRDFKFLGAPFMVKN